MLVMLLGSYSNAQEITVRPLLGNVNQTYHLHDRTLSIFTYQNPYHIPSIPRNYNLALDFTSGDGQGGTITTNNGNVYTITSEYGEGIHKIFADAVRGDGIALLENRSPRSGVLDPRDTWSSWTYRTESGTGPELVGFTADDYAARTFMFGLEFTTINVVVYRTRTRVTNEKVDNRALSGQREENSAIANSAYMSSVDCIDASDDYDTYFRGLDRFEDTTEDVNKGVVYYDFTGTTSYIYLNNGVFTVEFGFNRDEFNCAHEAYAELLTRP